MNILLSAFACEPNKGSEPGVGWNWAINLAKKHNVYVITRGESQPYIEKYMKENPIENLFFFYFEDNGMMHFIDKKIPMGFRIYYKWWQKKIVPIVKKIVKSNKIDIIQQLTYNEFRTPGKLYQIDVPFVWGPIGGGHEYNPTLKEGFFRKSDILLEKIRREMNHLYLHNKDVLGALNSAASVIVADPATCSILPKDRKYERLLETAYYSERNPIKKYEEKPDGTTIHLLYAGVMPPRKGIKIIIDALGESDFRDFELILIGDGKDRKLLEKLVDKYKITDKVKFLGQLTYDEVNRYYDWADLFLFPSIRDTSGNVVLESMSHGTPVIALNHNGTSEMITAESGDLIEIGSYSQIKVDFLNTIKKYYENRNLLEKKGKVARKRIEEVYSWEYVMEFMDNLYDDIEKKE